MNASAICQLLCAHAQVQLGQHYLCEMALILDPSQHKPNSALVLTSAIALQLVKKKLQILSGNTAHPAALADAAQTFYIRMVSALRQQHPKASRGCNAVRCVMKAKATCPIYLPEVIAHVFMHAFLLLQIGLWIQQAYCWAIHTVCGCV